MRIQHNIMAMNAYRNYNTNTSALSKNLEKLSSGYKINRAGDDAAGLAISEKMRAQITGLNAAQKNVKDGISLVKTAEGAMQEIQDMLNRMDYLATQSANGTYDNEVDRANLQKEVDALKTEINRIADSANFNGIKLLDGSLAGKSQVDNLTMSESTATKGKYETALLTDTGALLSKTGASLTSADIGKTLDYTVSWRDASGNEKTTTVSLTFQGDGTGAVSGTTASNYFTDASGAKYNLNATDAKLTAANLTTAIKNGLTQNEEFASTFNIKTTNTSAFEFESKLDGSAGAVITGIGLATTTSMDRKDAWDTANTTAANTVKTTQEPLDSMQKFDTTAITKADSSMTQEKIEEKIFEIDGQKFLITNGALKDDQTKALGDDVTVFKAAGATLTNDEVKELAAMVTKQTGLETKVYATAPTGSNITANTDIVFTQDRLKLSGKALTLQIGDTADAFNQMDVKIGDMHVSALGISDIDISNIEGAQSAIAKIKAAINNVSGVRGDLGAFQNRLEHTANNLSVMAENIQDAESTIRDTDVAEEMMAYTKNNILIQSAQAMLAQANAVPQGVLQLLG